MNPLIIIAIAAGLWYIPTLLTVLKLEVSFKSITPTRILENSIDFQLGLNIKNNGTNIRINTLDVDIYFNNIKIGHLFQNINTNISAGTDKVIYSNFSITPDNLGIETWRDVISIDLSNSVIRLSGKLTANGRPFPIDTDYTIKEIFENLDIIKQ